MRQDVIARQVAAMKAAGLDAICSCSPENFAYVTGFVSPTQPLMRWRHAMAIVTADGAVSLVVVDMEASTIRAKAPGTEIAVWKEFSFDAMAVLAEALTTHGLADARIGLELDYLPAADFSDLSERLPGATFAPAQALLARLRQLKTPGEIDVLRKLSRIADRAITESFHAVSAGKTEMDLAAALTRGVYEQGAEYFKLMIVATGERSVFPNVGPTGRVLKHGDVCRVEIFPMIDGYHAGVCRTAAIGAAPPEAERIWANLTACKHMLLEAIRPGASSRAIYERYLAMTEALKLPRISFIGHGIGLHLHEDPYLGPTADQPLEAGMVLGIEPLIYETGFGFGMQNKDMVLVTETGCELLSDVSDTDRLLVVG
ncbi:M24 family metallopeptidase [Rhodoplanes roseus]|uniref:Peptidase M24 n=2 Tax=Rhodoplanes TaxID=29407 RepID=A0A327KRE4_9BRAD|nr:Xaa-Pro peptidase family protein [Rhodoplanes roseus]RAI41510.1 peptidase M24 [Rhodoplanes roseus]